MTTTEESFPLQMTRLVSDPDFLALDAMYSRPNFFVTLGRTFTETWHSAFLGWLLDPRGSHGLAEYPLRRFLTAIACEALAPTSFASGFCDSERLAEHSLNLDLSMAMVRPCERDPHEQPLGDQGRIDVWVRIPYPATTDPSGPGELLLLIEMKVDASLGDGQAKRYADWAQNYIECNPRSSVVCILLTRVLEDTVADTVGDERWFALDYQLLHDEVLAPSAEREDFCREMKPLLQHYIENLRFGRVGTTGRALAVTSHEKQLAQRIYDKHKTAFHALADLLKDVEQFPEELSPLSSTEVTTPLILELRDGTRVSGERVRQFFERALEYLERKNLLAGAILPISTGPKRFLLSDTPVHPGGREFLSPLDFQSAGRTIYAEINCSRPSAVGQMRRLFQSLGVEVR